MSHVHSADGPAGCFGCKLRTIRFDKADERSISVRKRDREFAKDAEAYKRLRAEGLQPRGVDKSAMAETLADHKAEIELGRPAHKAEVHAYNRQMGAI